MKRFLFVLCSLFLVSCGSNNDCPTGTNTTHPNCPNYYPYQNQYPNGQYPNGQYPNNQYYPQQCQPGTPNCVNGYYQYPCQPGTPNCVNGYTQYPQYQYPNQNYQYPYQQPYYR